MFVPLAARTVLTELDLHSYPAESPNSAPVSPCVTMPTSLETFSAVTLERLLQGLEALDLPVPTTKSILQDDPGTPTIGEQTEGDGIAYSLISMAGSDSAKPLSRCSYTREPASPRPALVQLSGALLDCPPVREKTV